MPHQDKPLGPESRLLAGAAFTVLLMGIPPHPNGLSCWEQKLDKSLGGESRYLPDTADAVAPMMEPPHINDLSFK